MYYKKRTRLIAYIDGLLHSCLQKKYSHVIADCPGRKQVLASLIERYELGKWQPLGGIRHEQEGADDLVEGVNYGKETE